MLLHTIDVVLCLHKSQPLAVSNTDIVCNAREGKYYLTTSAAVPADYKLHQTQSLVKVTFLRRHSHENIQTLLQQLENESFKDLKLSSRIKIT